MTRLVLFSVLLFSFCSSLFAWSGAGHMVIAGIAYKELVPETKLKVSALLQSHPEYSKWTNAFKGTEAGMDLDSYVFLRASTWPDEIRRKHNAYDHPLWHYIDYPLRPKKFKMEEPETKTNDVLFGLAESEKVLSDESASTEARAAALSWLIHLVGDIHQPLHCASYFGPEFPKGDKGGNSFYVKPAKRAIKLHSLWDGLLGTRNQPKTQLDDAIRIRSEFPKSSTLQELPISSSDTLHKMWSLEGRRLAVEKVYLRGKLKNVGKKGDGETLPKSYTKEAKAVAEKQAALAGYRLANEIERNLH